MKSFFTTAIFLILSAASVASATQYICTHDAGIMNADEVRFDTVTRKASMIIGPATYYGKLTHISKHKADNRCQALTLTDSTLPI